MQDLCLITLFSPVPRCIIILGPSLIGDGVASILHFAPKGVTYLQVFGGAAEGPKPFCFPPQEHSSMYDM